MSYFVENWVRGLEAASFRINKEDPNFHPHITIVRPFEPRSGEDEIKDTIVNCCKGRAPITFCLVDKGNFDEVKYIPVISDDLSQFADELENTLETSVDFAPKLGDERILHLRINSSEEIDPFPRTESHMLRLTVIRNKLIWFSYDFVTQEVLDREQSLDKDRWDKTVRLFHDKI